MAKSIFGLSFIFFLLKLSYGKSFWLNLRNDNPVLYQKAVTVERICKKLSKYQLDVKFLSACRDENVIPKFTRWKNLKSYNPKLRTKFQRKILLDEITTKHREVNDLKTSYASKLKDLTGSATYFKGFVLRIAINRSAFKTQKGIQSRH